MKLKTRFFGEIEIAESEIVYFPQGIPGFAEEKEFVLLHLADDNPFMIMQSTNEPELAFITITPWEVVGDYEFEISKQVEELLQIEKAEDILVVAICNLPGKLEEMTVNLAAPVVINYRKNLGKQVVLEDSRYSIKHPAFPRQQQREVR